MRSGEAVFPILISDPGKLTRLTSIDAASALITSGDLPMKNLAFAVSGLAILGWLAMTPVAAQQSAIERPPELHAVNPSLSLSAPTTTPMQEQMREDYATDLRAAQRELLQQNPSGLSRQEQAIGRELNSYTGPR
jgi:hypothetical protein